MYASSLRIYYAQPIYRHARLFNNTRCAFRASETALRGKSKSIIDAPIKRCANKNLTTNTRARHCSSARVFDKHDHRRGGCSRKTIAPRVEIRKAARGFNLQLHTRVYLTTYVRYLCRIKSHLCRSQNKLLIIEIRRISLPLSPPLSLCLSLSLSFSLFLSLSLSRCYVNGLHTLRQGTLRLRVIVPAPFGDGWNASGILLCVM